MPRFYLPGYKTVCTFVGVAYVLLASSMLARGMRTSMEPFGLPQTTLSSPHFADFFHFFYVLMAVIGLLIVVLGWYVHDGAQQRNTARLLLLINIYLTYLDLRVSDSALGNGLYRGPGTIVPALIDIVFGLSFAYLSFRRLREREQSGESRSVATRA